MGIPERNDGIDRIDPDGSEIMVNTGTVRLDQDSACGITGVHAASGLPTIALPAADNMPAALVRFTRGGIPPGEPGRVWKTAEHARFSGGLPALGGSAGTVSGSALLSKAGSGFIATKIGALDAAVIPNIGAGQYNNPHDASGSGHIPVTTEAPAYNVPGVGYVLWDKTVPPTGKAGVVIRQELRSAEDPETGDIVKIFAPFHYDSEGHLFRISVEDNDNFETEDCEAPPT